MDAVGFFLLVFLVYTVVAVVAMMRVGQLGKEQVRTNQRIERLERTAMASASVVADVAGEQRDLGGQLDDLQVLMSNPLVKQMFDSGTLEGK